MQETARAVGNANSSVPKITQIPKDKMGWRRERRGEGDNKRSWRSSEGQSSSQQSKKSGVRQEAELAQGDDTVTTNSGPVRSRMRGYEGVRVAKARQGGNVRRKIQK